MGDVLKPVNPPYLFFHNVYIRDIYVRLWEQLCSDVVKQTQGKLFSLVIGAAGTGKSSFLCYALAKALHPADAGTELLFDLIIISSCSSDTCIIQYYVYTPKDARVVIKSESELVGIFEHSTATVLWLMDGKEHGPHYKLHRLKGRVLIILAASPDEKNYNLVKKLPYFKTYWMAPPGCVNDISDCIFFQAICDDYDDKNNTCYELIQMFEKCYAVDLKKEDCIERFQICGPVPRAVFSSTATASSLKSALDAAISCIGYDLLARAMDRYSMRSMIESKEMSSRLLLPIVDETFELKGVAACSDYVADQLFNSYHSKYNSLLITFLSKDPDEGFGSVWGTVFERHVLNTLCSSTDVTLNCTILVQDAKPNDVPLTVLLTVSELQKKQFCSYYDLSTILVNNSYAKKLLCPTSKTFGAIDALFVTDSVICLLQITRDIFHAISGPSLEKVLGAIPDQVKQNRSIYFLFIVPEGVVGKFHYQSFKNEKMKNYETVREFGVGLSATHKLSTHH